MIWFIAALLFWALAWALNVLLLIGFLQIDLLAAWLGGSAS